MRVELTYQHTLVQEFSVGLDAEWLAEAVGLSVDELLAMDGAELDARLETIHYALVNDPDSDGDYEREFSNFRREQFEDGELYQYDDEAE